MVTALASLLVSRSATAAPLMQSVSRHVAMRLRRRLGHRQLRQRLQLAQLRQLVLTVVRDHTWAFLRM